MVDKRFKLQDFYVPVRRPAPSLHYDLSLWCKEILTIHPFPFPDSLKDLEERVRSYADQRPDFPAELTSRIRVYIIDHRLYVPLILHDNDGSLAHDCYHFARYKHRYEDNIMGEGRPFLSLSSSTGYNAETVTAFIRQYDISPLEVLSVPTLVVFADEKLNDYSPLGLWQVCALMQRYNGQTVVDWSARNASFDFDVHGFDNTDSR